MTLEPSDVIANGTPAGVAVATGKFLQPGDHLKCSIEKLVTQMRTLVFFILFYLYLWLEVELRLIYHGGGMVPNFPVFFRGWAFFRQFTSYPGGLVEYLSAFLSQFFYHSWTGALVVTVQAWLICTSTNYFLKTIKAPGLRWLRFTPPILLLILYNQYIYHFPAALAVLTALLFVCLYFRVAPADKPLRLFVFLLLSVTLYYIAGPAYLLFAALCVIHELLFERSWHMGLIYLVSAAVIPYVIGPLIFRVRAIHPASSLLFLFWQTFPWKTPFMPPRHKLLTLVRILYLLLPLTALALGLWRILLRKKIKAEPRSTTPLGHTGVLALRWLIQSCLLFAIAGAAALISHDKKLKAFFEVDYYACHRAWPQVLAAARHNRQTYFVIHAVNRALYHTGRLPYDMFAYPQHPDTLLLTAEEHISAHWKRFDTYLDLGLVNMAEHDATHCLEILGDRPLLLQRLALINMVKANSDAARSYLGALSKTLFYSHRADDCLSQLDSDSNLSQDDQVRHLRRMMLNNDHDFSFLTTKQMFAELLSENKQNHMAFEYLMALYMLTGQLDKFVQNLHRIDDFDYPDIPPLYEQAILLYTYNTKKEVRLRGRQIRQQSIKQFNDFIQTFNLYGANRHAALEKLTKDYGHSYLFYATFGLSGVDK